MASGSVVTERLQGTVSTASVVGTIAQRVGVVGTLLVKTEASTAPRYSGDYEVTPKAYEDQVLATNGKMMTDDVTVLEIPCARVDNTFDGITVSIG